MPLGLYGDSEDQDGAAYDAEHAGDPGAGGAAAEPPGEGEDVCLPSALDSAQLGPILHPWSSRQRSRPNFLPSRAERTAIVQRSSQQTPSEPLGALFSFLLGRT